MAIWRLCGQLDFCIACCVSCFASEGKPFQPGWTMTVSQAVQDWIGGGAHPQIRQPRFPASAILICELSERSTLFIGEGCIFAHGVVANHALVSAWSQSSHQVAK